MSTSDEVKDYKHFRRRRKSTGATWTPSHKSADKPDGVWCRFCKMRHGYMTVGCNYERRGTNWWILWSCPNYGHVINEQELRRSNER